jgi:hypothetical protein
MTLIENLRRGGNGGKTAADSRNLAAVEEAVLPYIQGRRPYQPQHGDHSKDVIAQAFKDAGEAVAEGLEKLGNKALEDGQRRKAEYDRQASLVRQKSLWQADEAIDFVNSMESMRAASAGFVKTKPSEPEVTALPTPVEPASD